MPGHFRTVSQHLGMLLLIVYLLVSHDTDRIAMLICCLFMSVQPFPSLLFHTILLFSLPSHFLSSLMSFLSSLSFPLISLFSFFLFFFLTSSYFFPHLRFPFPFFTLPFSPSSSFPLFPLSLLTFLLYL